MSDPNETTTDMVLVALSEKTGRLATLEVTLKQRGTEAWFTVSCPCGCDQGAVVVSLDGEALWLAASLIEAVERLSSPDHKLRTA